MNQLPPALTAMAAYRQFILYKVVPSKTRPGKADKFPMTVAGEWPVDAHDPTHWVTAGEALNAAQLWGEGHGLGFVFTANDPFFFVDVDDCYDGQQWSKMASDLCTWFTGAAVEVSQSGRGLHIIGTGTPALPTNQRRKKAVDPVTGSKVGLFDIYTDERFVALTGTGASGDAGFNHQVMLDHIVSHWLTYKEGEQPGTGPSEWTTTHQEGAFPIDSDDILIDHARRTKSAASTFGNSVSFDDLWTNNTEGFAAAYPSDQNDEDYDRSKVDGALAAHLAWWTGGNCERIERLMRRSALVRDKWDNHKSYMKRTITGACANCTSYYSSNKPLEIVDITTVNDEPVYRDGFQFMAVSDQVKHFKGCVYVASLDKIFTPNGSFLTSARFNSMYGGYVFCLDAEADKSTRKAWEAFTESQALTFPKVDDFIFRPTAESGAILTEEGRRYVNTYVPIEVETRPGDVTPFLIHLEKVLPDERDRQILLSYMAACVQYKGYKIQWAPMLQGVEGNGKTLFTRCVRYALGKRYTHMPQAEDIGNKFNAWLVGKLFIGVEDIYVPDHKREVLEILKPMITGGDGIGIQQKGIDQNTMEICCNFMFNSNHKDAIKKTLNDRRFCVMYSAQQQATDLVRDGMTGDYFNSLYNWLNGDGYAFVTDYLINFEIPVELNPTGLCQRAPTTSSTGEAVSASLGVVEQTILEAIEEGRTGFAGGWVSSFSLDKMLENMRKGQAIPPNKRRALMQSLGYDWHPHLKNGRVNNAIAMEDGKPRLFIRDGHIHSNLTSPAEIARHYCAAQGDPLAMPIDTNVINS